MPQVWVSWCQGRGLWRWWFNQWTSVPGRAGREGAEHSDTALLQEVFAPGILVQSEVHHFWGRGPVLLGSHCYPWLRGLGAPEWWAALPGGHALDHPSPGMHTPAVRRGTHTASGTQLSSAVTTPPPVLYQYLVSTSLSKLDSPTCRVHGISNTQWIELNLNLGDLVGIKLF